MRLLLPLLLFNLLSLVDSYVVLKLALDANGLIGSTDSVCPPPQQSLPALSSSASNSNPNNFRFTSSASLDMVHRLRSRCDYVITGSNTVIQDNPSFSCRRGVAYTRNGGRKPVRPPPLSLAALSQNIANPPTQFRSTKQADGPTRVILDRSLKTFLWETSNFPETLTILHPTENSTPPSAPTIIYHTSLPPHPNPSPKVSLKKLEGEERIGRRIIDDLGENSEEDQAIMIEGGGNLAKVFLEDGENI